MTSTTMEDLGTMTDPRVVQSIVPVTTKTGTFTPTVVVTLVGSIVIRVVNNLVAMTEATTTDSEMVEGELF